MTTPSNVRAARAAALLAHQRFPEARRLQIDGYLALYSGDPALNKLLVEGARHLIFTFVVCLAAAQREEAAESWLTLGRLQDVVAAHQAGSPGLVEAIVNRMISRGLLTQAPAPGDRRKRILVPTEALLDHDRDLIAVQAAPCLYVAPSAALALAAARDPAFHQTHRVASVAAFGDGMLLLAAHKEMMLFIARDSGLMVLFVLLSVALASPCGTRATISYQEIAERFGVSRTHVRDLVNDAETAGLLTVAAVAEGSNIEITPRLWRIADLWIADCMVLFIECCEQADERLKQPTPG